ncbi:hypothetical protein GQ44DRAFT_741963 [Phaeosphaeriaceae sp. PMI808]|nr:hypothetical protein GQ44DRAFT_741963 [Phaeosphaeriaceae sp. PMI808]
MCTTAFRSPQASFWNAPLLALLLYANVISAHRWYNWQFDLTCESTSYFVPADEAELAAFVSLQHGSKSMLKVVGNGNAFGNIATNRSFYIISLTNFNKMQVDSDKTVTFGAGWDLADLVPELRANNLSDVNLVIGFRVMDAGGNILVYLQAYIISLGSPGLIIECTTQMYSDIDNLCQQHEPMMVWGPHMAWNSTTSNWDIDPLMSYLRNYTRYDEATDVVSTPPAGVCNRFFYTEIEHFLPAENSINGVASSMTGYSKLDMIYELRVVKGDGTWMSPANIYNLGQNSNGIFASLAQQFESKFGLQYNFNTTYAQDIYPKLEQFLNLQEKMDPYFGHLGITHRQASSARLLE